MRTKKDGGWSAENDAQVCTSLGPAMFLRLGLDRPWARQTGGVADTVESFSSEFGPNKVTDFREACHLKV